MNDNIESNDSKSNEEILWSTPALTSVVQQLLDYYRKAPKDGMLPVQVTSPPPHFSNYQPAPVPAYRPTSVVSIPRVKRDKPPKPVAAAAKPVPRIPSWVKGDPLKDKKPHRRAAGQRNAKIVEEANRSKARYDFVLYGDSITQIVADRHMDIWKRYFGHLQSSAPLGVGGNTVEELSFRLALGKERFQVAPKVVALLIGINNVNWAKNDPSEKLDQFLVPYLRAIWPDTKLLLLGMLPNKSSNVKPYNTKYKRLAEKHGATYVACGADLDPSNTTYFPDGTHPSAEGYHAIYPCLKAAVDAALRS